MRRNTGLVVVALLLAVSACTGDEEEPPSATMSTGTTVAPTTNTTTATPETTEPPDPFAIPEDPADIDVAYVQRVVNALYEVDAMASEQFVRSRSVSDEGVGLLDDIYVGEALDAQITGWNDIVHDENRLANVRPGSPILINEVSSLLTARQECLFLEVTRDYSQALLQAPPPRQVFLGLELVQPVAESKNPTPWALFLSGPRTQESGQIADPCLS